MKTADRKNFEIWLDFRNALIELECDEYMIYLSYFILEESSLFFFGNVCKVLRSLIGDSYFEALKFYYRKVKYPERDDFFAFFDKVEKLLLKALRRGYTV